MQSWPSHTTARVVRGGDMAHDWLYPFLIGGERKQVVAECPSVLQRRSASRIQNVLFQKESERTKLLTVSPSSEKRARV